MSQATDLSSGQPKPIGHVTLAGFRCHCGHEWLPRPGRMYPVRCPKCQSFRWDKPARERRRPT